MNQKLGKYGLMSFMEGPFVYKLGVNRNLCMETNAGQNPQPDASILSVFYQVSSGSKL